jgi:hypothetical protein
VGGWYWRLNLGFFTCWAAWAIPPILFCAGYFGHRSHFLTQAWSDPWFSYFRIHAIARMTGAHNYTQIFLLRWGLRNILDQTGLEPLFLISASHEVWDDRHIPQCPAICWDGVLLALCLGWPWTIILLISAS